MAGLTGLKAICGLEAEAKLLRPLGVEALVTAGDPVRSKAAAERAVARSTKALLSFGIAGGLAPGLASGTLLLPRTVVSESGEIFAADDKLRSVLANALHQAGIPFVEDELLGIDQMAMTQAAKAALYARSRAAAVDTESLFVARAAVRVRRPFLVLRAISDPYEIALPPAASVGLDERGRPAILPVLLSLLQNPLQLPGLFRAARDANRALAALKRAVTALGRI